MYREYVYTVSNRGNVKMRIQHRRALSHAPLPEAPHARMRRPQRAPVLVLDFYISSFTHGIGLSFILIFIA